MKKLSVFILFILTTIRVCLVANVTPAISLEIYACLYDVWIDDEFDEDNDGYYESFNLYIDADTDQDSLDVYVIINASTGDSWYTSTWTISRQDYDPVNMPFEMDEFSIFQPSDVSLTIELYDNSDNYYDINSINVSIDCPPPSTPISCSPYDGASDVLIDTTLSWSCTAANYQALWFGTTNPPPFHGPFSPGSDPGDLQSNTTYYWKIDAYNDCGSVGGPVWSFTTVKSCTMISACWNTTSAIEGDIVDLTVRGMSDCEGKTVSFIVWEDDASPQPNQSVNQNPGSAVFKNGMAKTTWVAEWQEDVEKGDPEYFFEARVDYEKIKSSEEKVEELTVLPKTIIRQIPLPHMPGWYVGDQHMHSRYGGLDFNWSEPLKFFYPDPLACMVKAAKAKGLDWVIFTDHSVFLNNIDWVYGYNECLGINEEDPNFKCLYGEEVTVGRDWGFLTVVDQRGHYLAHPFTSNRLGYIDQSTNHQTVINNVNNAGGMGFIAHPFGAPGWEDFSVTGFTGLEIINAKDGIWEDDDTKTLEKWHEILRQETDPRNGFAVGIANSDAHRTDEIGYSFTYCYMDVLTENKITTALKNGHCVLSNGPFVAFTLQGRKIGEVANVDPGNHLITVDANSNEEFGDLSKLIIYIDGYEQKAIDLTGKNYSGDISINIENHNKYVHLRLETTKNKLAITNPIWFSFACSNDFNCPSDGCYFGTYRDYHCTNNICIHSNKITDNDNDGYDIECDGDFDDDDPNTYPNAPEICDGKDNNFNDQVDEDLTPPLCDNQNGVCTGSTKICGGTSSWLACDSFNYGPNFEEQEITCIDGLDNDCDTYTDFDDSDCENKIPDNTIFIDGYWTGCEDGTYLCPFNTIKEGIDAISPESKGYLYIKPGTYTGPENVPVSIYKNITFKNWGSGSIIIK